VVDVGNLGTNLGVTYAFILYNDKRSGFLCIDIKHNGSNVNYIVRAFKIYPFFSMFHEH
jgi:hypothetical protein